MINLNKASQQIGNTPSKPNKEYILEIWNTEFNWQICSFYKMYCSFDMKFDTLGGGIPNSVPNSSKLQTY